MIENELFTKILLGFGLIFCPIMADFANFPTLGGKFSSLVSYTYDRCSCPMLGIEKNISTLLCKGAVTKYGTEGGGRDLTGSPKLLDGKRWAKKLLEVINIGYEAICFRICFNSFTHVSNIVSANFAVRLVMNNALHLSF